MIDLFLIIAMVSAGVFMGAFFFVGLMWTIQTGFGMRHPGVWFLGSLVLRCSLTLLALYLISDGKWERVLLCLAGFIIARIILSRFYQIPHPPPKVTGDAENES
jgi:F1F0 ATPase subunit 2